MDLAQNRLCKRDATGHKTLLRQTRQAFGVRSRTGGLRKNRVITRHLPLETEFLLDPPDGWMKEQKRCQSLLDQIGPVVPSPEVREFVQNNLIQLIRRELAHQRMRNQDRRLH